MSDPFSDFEYDRRFFCYSLPGDLTISEEPSLIIQSYYIHEDNYALRVRIRAANTDAQVDEHTDPLEAVDKYRNRFRSASVTVKGPSMSGTRYEADREIDPDIAVELIRRGGKSLVKTRYTAWIGGRASLQQLERPLYCRAGCLRPPIPRRFRDKPHISLKGAAGIMGRPAYCRYCRYCVSTLKLSVH